MDAETPFWWRNGLVHLRRLYLLHLCYLEIQSFCLQINALIGDDVNIERTCCGQACSPYIYGSPSAVLT